MDKLLKIALMLTAIDGMSNVVNNATNSAMASMKKLKDYSIAEFGNGFMMLEAGKAGFNSMKPMVEAFGSLQEAQINLKMSMMQPGGVFDEDKYKKINNLAVQLSDRFAGSAKSYTDMMMTMKSNQIPEDVILGGAGKYGAMLSSLFKVDPQVTGEFMSRATKDFKLGADKMGDIADLAVRAKFAGVGKSGAEAVEQMTAAFSKGSLGIEALSKNMNPSQMLALAKEYTGIFTYMYTKGIGGDTFGTNMRRMFEQIASPEKLNKANEAAKQFGISLNFYDKKGNFAGLSNMVAEFDKMSNLTIQQRQTIIKSLGGRQGLEEAFVTAFATEGKSIFNTSMGNLFLKQGTITQRFGEFEKGLDYQKSVFSSTWTNTLATIGKLAEGPLTKFYILLNKASIAIREFVNNHPTITKMAISLTLAASTALMIAGTFKIFKVALGIFDTIMGISKAIKWLRIAFALASPGLWAMVTATWAWTTALLANPVTWIVLGIVAACAALAYVGYIVYKNWGYIGPFFGRMWSAIKGFFSSAVNFIWKNVLPFFMPQVLIIQHWDKIGPYFAKLWNDIKKIFMGMVYWIGDQATAFYNAGKNIVLNVWNGIKSLAHKPVEAMREMVGKIRNLLPFSPAKDGPLKDIHRIRLIETISESLQAAPLLNKMRSIATQVFELRPQQASISPLLAASGGNVTIHLQYAPVYHAAPGEQPGAANDSFMKWANDNKRQLMEMIRREMGDGRKSYS